SYALQPARWLDAKLRTPTMRAIDAQGLARPAGWTAGAGDPVPKQPLLVLPPFSGSTRGSRGEGQRLLETLARATEGTTLAEADIVRLFRARGEEFDLVCATADQLRRKVNGDTVTYVVTRNINYTNICYFRCQFCAFSKGKLSENLRGKPYNL